MNFLEKVWTLFMVSVFVEGIIKDLIIFKDNPELVQEINKGIISENLTALREEYGKITFNIKIITEFSDVFELNEEERKMVDVIRLSRDIFGHCRISVDEKKLWYCPYSKKKLEEICLKFDLWKPIGNNISISESSLDFWKRLEAYESLDSEFFPKLAESIGLDYSRIR